MTTETASPTDPLNLRHRIHVSTSDHGYEARCVCGWSCCRPTRELRQRDIDNHRAVLADAEQHDQPPDDE